MSDRVVHVLRLLREIAAFSDQTKPNVELWNRLVSEFVNGKNWSASERDQILVAIARATNT